MLDKTPRNLLVNNDQTPQWVLVPELPAQPDFNHLHCLGGTVPPTENIGVFWPVSRP
jgi:hypothetical protein